MKILQILNKLSTAEKRRVKEAIASPFFNKNTKLIQLWEVLSVGKEDNSTKLKLAIHNTLFDKDPYDDLAIRHLLSKLQKLIEEIIGIMQLQSETSQINMAYAQWLNGQELVQLHEQKLDSITNDTPTSLTDYYWQYQWTQEREQFATKNQVRHGNVGLQDVSIAFDKYFVVHKLKMACAAYSLQTIYKQQFSIGFIDEILGQYETREPTEPLILFYYLGLQTLRAKNATQYFTRLKLTLLLPSLPIDRKERMDLFILAQNHCIRMVNSGQEEYFQELFDLYEAMLRQELIQHDAVQFPPAFKNIVSVALRLKAFDWVEQFITTHADYLEPTYREDYLNYNLARVYFEQHNYDETQNCLMKVQYKDFFIGLNARMLLLKVYYELDLYDLAFSQMDSFKQYLSRKEVMSYHKQNYQNNLKYIKRLLNLNTYDKARKKLLYDQISGEQVLTEKKWLLEKLGQFN